MFSVAYVIRTDELSEAYDSLLMTSGFLDEVPKRVYIWTWVTIALHNAVQGFMVTALLEGTIHDKASDRISLIAHPDKLKELQKLIEKGKEWGTAYDKVRWMHTASRLFAMIQDPKVMTEQQGGTPVEVSDVQELSFTILNRTRNEFIHSKPSDLALIVDGFDWEPIHCAEVLEKLIFKSGTISFGPRDDFQPFDADDVRQLLAKLREQGQALNEWYHAETVVFDATWNLQPHPRHTLLVGHHIDHCGVEWG